MWVLSARMPRQLVGLSSGQFIAMLWLHLPLELPKCPQGAIHCSCILVNSLPWTGAATCHCNVATRRRNCILHFCPASTSPTPTSLHELARNWSRPPFESTSWSTDVNRRPLRKRRRIVPSATQESSRPVPQQVAPSRLLVNVDLDVDVCSIPQLVMPRASRNQLATVCFKLTNTINWDNFGNLKIITSLHAYSIHAYPLSIFHRFRVIKAAFLPIEVTF